MADEKKKEVKKTIRVKKSGFYTIENEKVIRNHKCCQKCGLGVFLADHKDRYSCGKCGYTEWK